MDINTERILDKWTQFTLINDNGMEVSVLDYDGIITKIMVPDKNGTIENVVLGYKNYEDYELNPNFFGALIGRVAGRIQNSSFTLGEDTYSVKANEGKHHLHGGPNGFNHVIWEVEPVQARGSVALKLTHKSPDGEGGYPGNVKVAVTYTLNNDNKFILDYEAITDKRTALTLTNHSYFNLSGNLQDTIHHHHVAIDSDRFVELDEELIPTGKLLNVADTPFDFRRGRLLEDGIKANTEQNKIAGHGYDHYFIFAQNQQENVKVKEATSGRVLTVKTNQPGMVMYTANGLDEGLELREGSSQQHLGVCFETQSSPASLHYEGFPTVVLEADEVYRKQTVFEFSTEG